ncbi:MAG: elongation factor G [Candidatus Thiodiazotropha sp.]
MSQPIPISSLRNIGLIAHIDAGKTTVTERILYYTGRTRQIGSVDHGTTITDWMDQERERGITIVDAAVTTHWREHQINLIDTPGHIDFTAEVQRALRVLDGAVVIFDASQGVEPQSETVWRQADRYRVPRLCFINKMDRLGADFDHAVETLVERLDARPVVIQIPMGSESDFTGVIDLLGMQAITWSDAMGAEPGYGEIPPQYLDAARIARSAMIETIASEDDQLLSLWLDNSDAEPTQIREALRRVVVGKGITPVLCGSALKNKGIQPLMDAVVDYLPSPADIAAVEARHPDRETPISCPPDPQAPLCALVFKTVTDPYAGRLCYVRVYSGELKAGAPLLNPRFGRPQKVGRLERMYAEHREDIDHIPCGDIAAVLGLKEAVTGDTLCAPDHPMLLESIVFPDPVIKITVTPVTAQDNDRLADALQHLADDDPTFRTEMESETGQMLLAGMGELHLEVLLERLKREQGVNVRTGKPRVAYKETISREVSSAEGKFIRQTGGQGQYGHVVISVSPAPEVDGIEFSNGLVSDAIPKQYLPAIETGLQEASRSGVIGGYPVTGLRITLLDGSAHSKDSNPLAFKIAAGMALRDALEAGKPILLEPVVACEVTIPEEHLGDVMGQLASRNAEILGMTDRPGGRKAIRNHVALSGMFGYATDLRSATHGLGTFTMQLDHYAPVSPQVMKSFGR